MVAFTKWVPEFFLQFPRQLCCYIRVVRVTNRCDGTACIFAKLFPLATPFPRVSPYLSFFCINIRLFGVIFCGCVSIVFPLFSSFIFLSNLFSGCCTDNSIWLFNITTYYYFCYYYHYSDSNSYDQHLIIFLIIITSIIVSIFVIIFIIIINYYY